jgi:hypothetical protein
MPTFSAIAGWLREGISLALTRYLFVFVQGAREGLEIEARYHALARKSKRDLAELGLKRGQIARVAVNRIQSDVLDRPASKESAGDDSASEAADVLSRRLSLRAPDHFTNRNSLMLRSSK